MQGQHMNQGSVPNTSLLAPKPAKLAALALIGAVLAGLLGGCGYSARDEYMQIQSMAVPPMASADPAREQAYLVWAASRDVTPDRALVDAEALRLTRADR